MTRIRDGSRERSPYDTTRGSRAPNGAIWGLALVINQNLRTFGGGAIIGSKLMTLLWRIYDHSFTQAGFQYEDGETEDAGLLCSFDLAAWATALGWHKPFLSKKYHEALDLCFLTCRPASIEKPGDAARFVLRWNHPSLWLPLQEGYQRDARSRHSRQGAGRPQQEAGVHSGISQGVVIDFTSARKGQEAGVHSGIIKNAGRRYFQDSYTEIPELTPASHKEAPGADSPEPLRTTKKETKEYSVTNVTGSVTAASSNLVVEEDRFATDQSVSGERIVALTSEVETYLPTAERGEEILPAILPANLDLPTTPALLASWQVRLGAQSHLTSERRSALHQAGIPIRTRRLEGKALREAREKEARLREEYEEERGKLAWMQTVLRTAERNPQHTVEQIEALARAYYEGSLEEPCEEPPEAEEPAQLPWPLLRQGAWHQALVARLFEVFDLDSREANDNERGQIVRTAKLLRQSRIRPEAVSNLKDYYEGLLSRNRRGNEPLPYYSPPAIAKAASDWKKACRKLEEEQGRYDQWGDVLPSLASRVESPAEPKRRRRQKNGTVPKCRNVAPETGPAESAGAAAEPEATPGETLEERCVEATPQAFGGWTDVDPRAAPAPEMREGVEIADPATVATWRDSLPDPRDGRLRAVSMLWGFVRDKLRSQPNIPRQSQLDALIPKWDAARPRTLLLLSTTTWGAQGAYLNLRREIDWQLSTLLSGIFDEMQLVYAPVRKQEDAEGSTGLDQEEVWGVNQQGSEISQ